MANISSITLPDGNSYDLKDKNALPAEGTAVKANRLAIAHSISGANGWYTFFSRAISSSGGAVNITLLIEDTYDSSVGILRIYFNRNSNGYWTGHTVRWLSIAGFSPDNIRYVYGSDAGDFTLYVYKSSNTAGRLLFRILNSVNRAGEDIDLTDNWLSTAISEPTTATAATANINNNAATATNASNDKDGNQIDTTYQKVNIGVCDTAAGTAAKTVSISTIGNELTDGTLIHIRFNTRQSSTNPTLNVNGIGAYPIRMYRSNSTTYNVPQDYWVAGEWVDLMYDSTYSIWIPTGKSGMASTTHFGYTKLEDSVSSTSTSTAATPNSVKTAYDLAAAALPATDTAVDAKQLAVAHTITGNSGWYKFFDITSSGGTQNLTLLIEDTYGLRSEILTILLNQAGSGSSATWNVQARFMSQTSSFFSIKYILSGSNLTVYIFKPTTTTGRIQIRVLASRNRDGSNFDPTPYWTLVSTTDEALANAEDVQLSVQPLITTSGILKGDGTGNISAATAGTDYATPAMIPTQASDIGALAADGTAAAASRLLYTHSISGAAGWYHFLDIPTVTNSTRAVQLLIDNGQSSVSGILRIYIFRTSTGSLAGSSTVNWMTTTIPIDYVRWTYSNGVTSFYVYKSSSSDRALTFNVLSAINRAGTNLSPTILDWDNTAVSEPTTATPATANILNNAATATDSQNDINGDQIDTTYLKIADIDKGKNLLRNWYFVGGGSQQGGKQFPINTRGKTAYTGTTYGIDGWVGQTSAAAIEIQSGYITVSYSGTSSYTAINQKLLPSLIDGKTVTATIWHSGGLTTATASNISLSTTSTTLISTTIQVNSTTVGYLQLLGTSSEVQFRIRTQPSSNYNVYAVKLEYGTTQTLCKNTGTAASPVWSLVELPDWDEEYLKCAVDMTDSNDLEAHENILTTRYGIGTQMNNLNPILDANTVSNTGFYLTNTSTSNLATGTGTNYKEGVLEAIVRSDSYKFERNYNFVDQSTSERYTNTGDTGWSPWRYIDRANFIASTDNLNAYKDKPGFYYYTSRPTNAPGSYTYCAMLVLPRDGGKSIEIIYAPSGKEIWRVSDGTTWTTLDLDTPVTLYAPSSPTELSITGSSSTSTLVSLVSGYKTTDFKNLNFYFFIDNSSTSSSNAQSRAMLNVFTANMSLAFHSLSSKNIQGSIRLFTNTDTTQLGVLDKSSNITKLYLYRVFGYYR